MQNQIQIPKSENLIIRGQIVQMSAEDKGKNGKPFIVLKVKIAQDASYTHNGQHTPKTNGVEVQFTGSRAEKIASDFQLQPNGKLTFISPFQKGHIVEIAFQIEGRTYDKRDGSGKGFFQNLSAWKMEHYNIQQPIQQAYQNPMPAAQPVAQTQPPVYAGTQPVSQPQTQVQQQPVFDDDLPF